VRLVRKRIRDITRPDDGRQLASDRWIVAGATPNRLQKTLLATAMAGVALTMMACVAAGPTLSVALLAAAAMFFGMTVPNIYAIAQTLGGHRAAGQWMGIQNLIGNLAGVLAPLITGFVLDRTDHYYWAFVIAALVALAGSLAFGVCCIAALASLTKMEGFPY
jgi:ACS family D-galactonate transporter-like MFS transporter